MKNKFMKNLWCRVVILLLPFGAVALIPPLSNKELLRQSDIIVEGVVSRIDKVGTVFHDHCYGWQKHLAVILVERVVKGAQNLTSIGVEYDTRVINDKGCVGGRDSYTLMKGHRYLMYLKKIPGRSNRYHFFNWAGLKRK